jgi:hypothetical protein
MSAVSTSCQPAQASPALSAHTCDAGRQGLSKRSALGAGAGRRNAAREARRDAGEAQRGASEQRDEAERLQQRARADIAAAQELTALMARLMQARRAGAGAKGRQGARL